MPCNKEAQDYMFSMQAPNGGYGLTPGFMSPRQMPTGFPTGPSMGGLPLGATVAPYAAIPTMPMAPAPAGELPQTVASPLYTAGFLRTQLGRRIRVEFLIGSGPLVDRTGTLIGVGSSYILLRPVDTDDIMMCDLYSIKFVTVLM